MKSFTIYNDLYRCSYLVIISKKEEFIAELNRLGYETDQFDIDDDSQGGETIYWGNGMITVWFKENVKKRVLISDIAHEATHVALFTCENAGIGVSKDVDDHETPAYIITFFIDELFKNLKKRDFIQL